jgi:hypothetical protein
MSTKFFFRTASIFWGIWGLVHLFAGFAILSVLAGGIESLPKFVPVKMMGSDMPLHIVPTLMEHNFNNTWFGLVVLIGSFFVWKANRKAVFFCSIVGGLAQLGFALFMVFPGHSAPPGVIMNFVVGAAIVLGIIANVRKGEK